MLRGTRAAQMRHSRAAHVELVHLVAESVAADVEARRCVLHVVACRRERPGDEAPLEL